MFIDYIKNWIGRRRCKSILKDIKKAKDIYLRHESDFMCICFSRVDDKKYRSTNKLQKRIPEFNREFLEAKNPDRCIVWWPSDDRESRIEAFDKLIEVYSRNYILKKFRKPLKIFECLLYKYRN